MTGAGESAVRREKEEDDAFRAGFKEAEGPSVGTPVGQAPPKTHRERPRAGSHGR